MKVVLPRLSRYAAKDQLKANIATKFIGRGSPASSTAAYAIAFGDKSNCGVYSSEDRVFVSAEGNRRGRIAPDFSEISKAINAKALIITDDLTNRSREYNVGEREVAHFLKVCGYKEIEPGIWR